MAKRRKLKKKNFTLLIIAVLIVTFLSINLYSLYLVENEDTNKVVDENKNEEPIITYPLETSFSLMATGDALVHSSIYLQYKTTNGYDFSSVFNDTYDYINQFDVKYINQETVFADGSYSGYPLFNTPSEWGDALINAGFNLFSLATNHSYDQFSDGALENVAWWQSQSDIGYAGMNLSSDEDVYYIDEVNGITYGFLSYTEHTNGLAVPSDKSYLVSVYSEEKALEEVEELSQLVDVVIVAMHWGTEYTSEPNSIQVEIANELSSMGVDVILGNHPHWTQPIDYIEDTLVIYSMGNFISNQLTLTNSSYYTESVAVGALVSFDINMLTYEDESTEVFTDNIVVELVYNYRDSAGEYYVIPFSKMSEEYNSDYLTIYEEHKERLTMYSDLVTVNAVG